VEEKRRNLPDVVIRKEFFSPGSDGKKDRCGQFWGRTKGSCRIDAALGSRKGNKWDTCLSSGCSDL